MATPMPPSPIPFESFGVVANEGYWRSKSAFAAEYLAYIYSELKGSNENNFTGALPDGAMRWVPEDFCDCTPLAETYDAKEFPFVSTNYKPRFRSVSMQANNPIMRDLCASNYLELNLDDAAELGIRDGDRVRITNPTGDVMEGEAMVRAGIARGTFGMAYGYGHRAYGAKAYEVDGEKAGGNAEIGAGVHLQTMLDPKLGDGVIYPLSTTMRHRLDVPAACTRSRRPKGGERNEREEIRHVDRPVCVHRVQCVRRCLQAGKRCSGWQLQHVGGKLGRGR